MPWYSTLKLRSRNHRAFVWELLGRNSLVPSFCCEVCFECGATYRLIYRPSLGPKPEYTARFGQATCQRADATRMLYKSNQPMLGEVGGGMNKIRLLRISSCERVQPGLSVVLHGAVRTKSYSRAMPVFKLSPSGCSALPQPPSVREAGSKDFIYQLQKFRVWRFQVPGCRSLAKACFSVRGGVRVPVQSLPAALCAKQIGVYLCCFLAPGVP